MGRKSLLAVLALVFALATQVNGQTSLKGSRYIDTVDPDSVYALHPWVLLESIVVTADGKPLEKRYWQLNRATGAWSITEALPDSTVLRKVLISFRYLPLSGNREFFQRELVNVPLAANDSTSGNDSDSLASSQVVRRALTADDLFGNAKLDKSGSLSRGVTVGSNRDLSLESGLRLDLSGQITDDVEITAALTDQSTPIQPDGSTQNLREFDQVFIRLQSSSSSLQLGDIDINLQESEFARISRRLQGVNGATRQGFGEVSAAASVARGQFNSQQFNGVDGVQGPYRLLGVNGEQFVIVLAGTERVYIDGIRMTRGEENDYIIDYGLGELFFTSNRIIRQESRITVDFQYINQEFTRTLLAGEGKSTSLLGGKLTVAATVIREADSDNTNAQLSLTESEIDILRRAGDDPSLAVVSGVEEVGFDENADQVLYIRRDTTVSGSSFRIYENRPGDPLGVFRVRFTRTTGGPYQRSGRAVNGIVYDWVGPGLGDYDTLRTITAPSEQRMVAIRSAYKPSENVEVFGEVAQSTFDRNRFSNLDDGDNNDHAYLAGTRLKSHKTDAGTFTAHVRQRYSGKRFSFFDRTRDIEFNRKWNIDIGGTSAASVIEERITEAGTGWEISETTKLEFGAGLIDRTGLEANRQNVRFSSAEVGLPSVDYLVERVESDNGISNEKGTWVRQRGTSAYSFPFLLGTLTPSVFFEQENRAQKMGDSGDFAPNALRFYDVRPALKYQVSEKFAVSGEFAYRQDQRVLENRFRPQARGITQTYTLDYKPGALFTSSSRVAFRDRDFSREFELATQSTDSKGLFVQSVSTYRPLKKAIDAQFLYEANTERKALLQETFIEVGPELGQFVWDDLNGDGIQQIDEFFLEQTPNEGIFIKQFVPSDQLLPVISLKTRLRTRVAPARILGRPRRLSGWKRALASMEWNSSIEVRENSTTTDLADVYLLRLNTFRDDSTTLQGRISWRNELILFQGNPKFGLNLRADQSRSSQRQVAGLERRTMSTYQAEASYRIQRRITATGRLEWLNDQNFSENLASRNFEISSISLNPKVNVQFSREYQFSFGASYARKTDVSTEIKTEVDAFKAETGIRFYIFDRLQGFGRVESRNVRVQGNPGGLSLFELTDGAGEGGSWLWSLQANYRISNLIRASLNYDGRTAQTVPAIHTLRFVISAVF